MNFRTTLQQKIVHRFLAEIAYTHMLKSWTLLFVACMPSIFLTNVVRKLETNSS